MRKIFSRKMAFFYLLLTLGLALGHGLGFAATLEEIDAAIQAQKAGWIAGETSISHLSVEQMALRLGGLEPQFTGKERLARPSAPEAGLPPALDWRDHGGDYVTSIKDQGDCGSCWAFATTAALESYTLIKNNTPNRNTNLSEQVVLSCGEAGNCYGGYSDYASSFIRDTGVPVESCYPYTEANGSCGRACDDWRQHTRKIDAWSYVTTNSPTVGAIKTGLYTYGPLVTSMDVYEDFQWYRSGVYSHVRGPYEGGHDVLIVGYDDARQCFIVKNSWGAGWGESGFFRIAYSQINSLVRFGYWTIAYSRHQRIEVSPALLHNSCALGKTAPRQTFKVWNAGGSTLNYHIRANVSWLQVSPQDGASTGEHDTFTVTYATRSLGPGVHKGAIIITDPQAPNSPQTLPVTLQVNVSLPWLLPLLGD